MNFDARGRDASGWRVHGWRHPRRRPVFDAAPRVIARRNACCHDYRGGAEPCGLTYLNARWLEEFVLEQIADHKELRHLILMCSAVNAVDASALESLEMINHRLAAGGVCLHLSEVKGPVMDALERSHLLRNLSSRVWLSQHAAFEGAIAMSDREHEAQAAPDLWTARGMI